MQKYKTSGVLAASDVSYIFQYVTRANKSVFTVGSLLAILRFLPCRAAAVSTGDILLLSGFGLHLALIGILPFAATAKGNAMLQNALEIVVFTHLIAVANYSLFTLHFSL